MNDKDKAQHPDSMPSKSRKNEPPPKPSFRVQLAKWPSDKGVISAIRRDVFIHEQGVAEHEEWDEYDESASTRHYLILDSNDVAYATARLVKLSHSQYKITRLAVHKHARRQGLGATLIKALNTYALCNDAKRIFLHAQLNAIGLYKKYGFAEVGKTFMEAGIEHIEMELELLDSHTFEANFSNRVIRLNFPHEFVTHGINIVSCGVRRVDICSINLRADIFSDKTLLNALSRFARNDRRAKIRILIHSSKNLNRRLQALIELARRLSSKIEIKVLDEFGERTPASFICADTKYLLFFNNEEGPEGFCCYRARAESESQLESFEHAWNHLAKPDPNLGQLHL